MDGLWMVYGWFMDSLCIVYGWFMDGLWMANRQPHVLPSKMMPKYFMTGEPV